MGAAQGGTLFLDELGELPETSQSCLLRLLDEGGEYHPLGASSARRSNLRVLGATNRDPACLKHDLAARLIARLTVPGLDERRDDIPLLVRHLLRRATENPETTPSALERVASTGTGPAIGADLIDALLHHPYTTHVRELHALLWKALEENATGAC